MKLLKKLHNYILGLGILSLPWTIEGTIRLLKFYHSWSIALKAAGLSDDKIEVIINKHKKEMADFIVKRCVCYKIFKMMSFD